VKGEIVKLPRVTFTVLLILLFSLLIMLMILTSPCKALDLDNDSIYDRMIESIDTEPENWILRDGQMYYISTGAEKVDDLYPEYHKNCTVHIYYRVLVPKEYVYVKIEKPEKLFLEGDILYKFSTKIRKFILKELKERYEIKDYSSVKLKQRKTKDTEQKQTNKTTNKKL
jgi:hypothetical protein